VLFSIQPEIRKNEQVTDHNLQMMRQSAQAPKKIAKIIYNQVITRNKVFAQVNISW